MLVKSFCPHNPWDELENRLYFINFLLGPNSDYIFNHLSFTHLSSTWIPRLWPLSWPWTFKTVFFGEQCWWPVVLCVSSSILCVPVSVCVFMLLCVCFPVCVLPCLWCSCVCVCLCPGVRALLTPYPTPTRVPPPPPPPSSSQEPPINFLQFICFSFQFLEQETNTKGKSSFCQNVTLLVREAIL